MEVFGAVLFLIACVGILGANILLIAATIRKKKRERKIYLGFLGGSVILFVAGMVLFMLGTDRVPPVITTYEKTINYSDTLSVHDFVTATDDKSKTIDLSIMNVSPEGGTIAEDLTSVQFQNLGDYTVTVSAKDQRENESTAEALIHVVDQVAPVFESVSESVQVDYGKKLTLSEDANHQNGLYVAAKDDMSDVSYRIVDVQPQFQDVVADDYAFDAESITLNRLGDYLVNVEAKDAYDNAASAAILVSAVDRVAPELSGLKTEFYLSEFDTDVNYLEGVTASDEIDGDLTGKIALDALNVSYGVPGNYTVTYSVADNAGNKTEKSVNVTIKDTTAPVMVMGHHSFSLTVGDSKPDYSSDVSANDAIDGKVSVAIDDSAVDYNTPGTYEVVYTVSDSSGNAASQSATVTVNSKPAETPVYASNNNSSSGETVYITNTGAKYHRGSCRYLRKSKIAISKSDAISQGYDACSVCNP